MSAALLITAGALAWGAQEASYSSAFRDWERHRLPSEGAWVHALGSLGWTESASGETLHKALRKLPAEIDSAGSVWVSSDLDWVVVYSDLSQTVSQHVFCRSCQTPPDRWESLGVGWSGFDSTMDRLGKAKKLAGASTKVRKSYKFVDAREIHY